LTHNVRAPGGAGQNERDCQTGDPHPGVGVPVGGIRPVIGVRCECNEPQ
jgi:hypothetical protein